MFNLSADRAIHSFSANMENEEGCFEVVYGVVADAGVVHHWDGSLDDAFGEVVVDARVVHHWDGSL